MRILLLFGFLLTTTSWAATLEFDVNDYLAPQIDTPGLQTRVKQVRCNGLLWGVVYEYHWAGGDKYEVRYSGVINYEYRMSAQVAIQGDTTPGYGECREKIEKHYGLSTTSSRVLDLDASDTPAASR